MSEGKPTPPIDEITQAVEDAARALGKLLELVISRAAQQSASVCVPLIERQRAQDARQEATSKMIHDLHRRLDERANQIDEQEQRITALEQREVGGGRFE